MSSERKKGESGICGFLLFRLGSANESTEERPNWMVDVVERPTTKYIVFPGPSEQELRETIGWETAGRRQARDPARWTSITGQLYDPHTQEQPQLVVRRMDEPDSTQVAFSGGGGFLLERNEGMQETYPDDEEITYEANETTTLGQSISGIRLHFPVTLPLKLSSTTDTTAPDTSTSAVIWSATQPLPTNLVQNPSINYSQFLHATPSQYLTQTVDAPQLRFNPIEITPLDSTRERMWLSENEKPFINILAAIIALEHPKETSGMPRTTWTLGDFTGATIRVTLFGNAVGWNPFVKVGDVIHLTSQCRPHCSDYPIADCCTQRSDSPSTTTRFRGRVEIDRRWRLRIESWRRRRRTRCTYCWRSLRRSSRRSRLLSPLRNGTSEFIFPVDALARCHGFILVGKVFCTSLSSLLRRFRSTVADKRGCTFQNSRNRFKK